MPKTCKNEEARYPGDFQDGKYIHLTPKGTIVIAAGMPGWGFRVSGLRVT